MKSAAVIQHPRAAAEPVRQTRGPGRLPKTVRRLRDLQFKRWCEGWQREVIEKEVAFLRGHVEFLEEHRAQTIDKLMWLQRTDLSDKERAAAARWLEWQHLPRQEKERQESLGVRAPDCPY